MNEIHETLAPRKRKPTIIHDELQYNKTLVQSQNWSLATTTAWKYQQLAHHTHAQPKHIFLMIYLLWDKKVHGRRSFFWPYYDILPKTLRNMPIFCESLFSHLFFIFPFD